MNNFTIYNLALDEAINASLFTSTSNVNMASVGDYKFSASNNDIGDWLICDGRSLLQSEYPELYSVIGISFGSNDPGEFNIPDFRGRVYGDIGSAPGLTTRNLGDSLGEETHTLTISEMPTHNHTGFTSSAGAHTHPITDPGHTHTYLGVQSQGAASGLDNVAENNPRPTETTSNSQTGITINSAGSHVHGISNQGDSLPHNNMQPTLFGGNIFILSKLYQYNYYPVV